MGCFEMTFNMPKRLSVSQHIASALDKWTPPSGGQDEYYIAFTLHVERP